LVRRLRISYYNFWSTYKYFDATNYAAWFFDSFYNKFAEMDSMTKVLYKGNLKIKAKALVGMINVILAAVRANKRERDRILHDLAFEHAKYGVSAAQYPAMGRSFLATMGEVLGEEGWTKETEHVWAVVWSAVLQSVVPAALQGERALTSEQKEFIDGAKTSHLSAYMASMSSSKKMSSMASSRGDSSRNLGAETDDNTMHSQRGGASENG
jgi:hemoglobin-like flavoprotein